MTDSQLTAILAVLGSGLAGIAAVIRWSAGRLTKALDDNSAAMLENTKSNAVLSTKIDGIAEFVRKVESGPTRTGRAPSNPVIGE